MNSDKHASANVPSVYAALKVRRRGQASLSAAQQRYNAFLEHIDALTTWLTRLQVWSDKHRHSHVQTRYQTAQAIRDAWQSLVFFLHDQLQGNALNAQQQRMARTLVRGWIEQLGPDAAAPVQALAELYRLDEDEQDLAQETQRLREQIEAALGQPIDDPDQYQTPQEMLAAGLRQWQRQQQADEARKAAKRAARQALRDPAGQQKAEGLQADARSTVRTLYRQLASALHPDRESDAQERQRKTALMSEVNAAYEKNDLSALLRLQMQTALVGADAASRLADGKLMAMCVLLKEQVSALEDDLAQLEARLSHELGVPVSAQFSEEALTQALQRLQAEEQQLADSLSVDLKRIQHEAELKRWLKAQSRAFKASAA